MSEREVKARLQERTKQCHSALDEVEKLRVQLAGCSVAASGGTTGSVVATKGDYGWSVAYQDVLELRLKYDELLLRIDGREK